MTNKNYLTSQAYKEMANEVADVIEDLRLMMNTIEFIKTPKAAYESSDMTVEYTKVYQYTDSLFNKLQGMIKALEHVNGTLYSVDDLRELQAFVRAEWIKDLEQAEY